MAKQAILLAFLMVSYHFPVEPTHFRGGVIMLQPAKDAQPNEMEIYFRISWRRNRDEGGYCTNAKIDEGTFIGYKGGDLECTSGCSGVLTKMYYQCTDFSQTENWSFGQRRFNHVFEEGVDNITVGFFGKDWIAPFNSPWSLIARTSLLPRNDTGKPNATPRLLTAPVVRLQAGCNHTIRIGVDDPDEDIVRCRWGVSYEECGGICGGFEGAVLDPVTCSIWYEATQGQGFKAAGIMVEDFLPSSNEPLSSISSQFLIYVFEKDSPCSEKPQFVWPTITSQQCVAIPSGTTFVAPLIANPGGAELQIDEIQTASPAGMQKSDIVQEGDNFYVNVTWNPLQQQENEIHQFCYTAQNSDGLSSEQTCISLLPGTDPPKVIDNTNIPNDATVFPNNATWKISFDQVISLPTVSAYINYLQAKNGKVVHTIDTSVSDEVMIENDRTLVINPNFRFEEKADFYINFDRGIITGPQGCKPGNEIIDDPKFWMFKTKDITPPILTFVKAANTTNSSVAILWNTDEPSTSICLAQFLESVDGNKQTRENCSSNIWYGSRLQEGNHQLSIVTIDNVGNKGFYKHSFYVDNTPPLLEFSKLNALTIAGQGQTMAINKKYANIIFRCLDPRDMQEDACTYECLLTAGESSDPIHEACSSTYKVPNTLAIIHDSHFSLSVIAIDSVGNRAKPKIIQWKTDFEAPIITGPTSGTIVCGDPDHPWVLGYPKVTDNQDPEPSRDYKDNKNGCTITRAWTSTDNAGNSANFVQVFTLSFELSISLSPVTSQSCDSSAPKVAVSNSTAFIPNPCSRPVELTLKDESSIYTCPGQFQREWSAVDLCSQNKITSSQTVALYDICQPTACGRDLEEPHGICYFGACECNKPWRGFNCENVIYQPKINPVQDKTIMEMEDYEQEVSLEQRTEPVSWEIVQGPKRLKIDQNTRKLQLLSSEAGNFSIKLSALNEAGSDVIEFALTVKPGYKVLLHQVQKTVYDTATPVFLTGYIEIKKGSLFEKLPSTSLPVEIDIVNGGYKGTLKTNAGKDRQFSVTFSPSANEYGIYEAHGRHPAATIGNSITGWKIKGMKLTNPYVILSGATDEPFRKEYRDITEILNDGPTELEDISADIKLYALEDYITLDVKLNKTKTFSKLSPKSKLVISITLNANRPLRATLPVALTSKSGTTVNLTLRIDLNHLLPSFVIDPPFFNTRVVRGKPKIMNFKLTNDGEGKAHSTHVLFPDSDQISLISFAKQDGSRQIFDMSSSDSASIDVLINIPASHQLGVITGNCLVSSRERDFTIPMNITVVSNVHLNLTLYIEDEYTYFAEGNPLVDTASVSLRNYQRNIYLEGSTEKLNGSVTFQNIPEDLYEMAIVAPQHKESSQVIMVSATQPDLTVFLERTAVTYSWNVVPVQFEDKYAFAIQTEFEANVPMPVVTIEPREIEREAVESGLIQEFNLNVTNHGLITAQNVELNLPEHPFLKFQSAVRDLGNLDAKSWILVNIKVTRKSRQKRVPILPIIHAAYALKIVYSIYCSKWIDKLEIAEIRTPHCPPLGGSQCFDGGQCTKRDSENTKPGKPGYNGPMGGSGGVSNGGTGGNGGGGDQSGTGTSGGNCLPGSNQDNCRPQNGNGFDWDDYSDWLPGLKDLLDFDFESGGASSETKSICDNKCIQAILGCVPDPNFPFAGCIPQLLQKPVPTTVIEGLSLLDCAGLTSKPFSKLFFLHQCASGIKSCLAAGFSKRRKRRGINDLTVDTYTSLNGIFLSFDIEIEFYGDQLWIESGNSTWFKDVIKPAMDDASLFGNIISDSELVDILKVSPENGATTEDIRLMVERINNTQYNWNHGKLEPFDSENMASFSKIQSLSADREKINDWAKGQGYSSYIDAYKFFSNEINKFDSWEEEASVCAVIKIKLDAYFVLTRNAFQGTLQIDNKEKMELTDIEVDILVTNSRTGVHSTHLFSISNPDVVNSGWSVPPGESGEAIWLFAPYPDAALIEDTAYTIGGKLTYTLDSTKIEVPLLPATVSVKPSPSLQIHYFWEKYVIGDDPITEIQEPSIPFSLGVAVKNNGFGKAHGLSLSSGEIEIVENEKGLAIAFEVFIAEIGTETVSPSLTLEFGDLHPNTTMIARWWMVSPLQAIFKNYSASFTYTNPLGDSKLSVLDELEIHELLRNVQNYMSDDSILDFLVLSKDEPFDTPYLIYDSNGLGVHPVQNGTVVDVKPSIINDTTYLLLTGESIESGWVLYVMDITSYKEMLNNLEGLNYFYALDNQLQKEERPTQNRWITRTRRKSEGLSITLNIFDYVPNPGYQQYLVELCSNCTNLNDIVAPPPFVPPTFLRNATVDDVTYPTKGVPKANGSLKVVPTANLLIILLILMASF